MLCALKLLKKNCKSFKLDKSNAVSIGMTAVKPYLSICPVGSVSFVRYCGEKFSHHLFSYSGLGFSLYLYMFMMIMKYSVACLCTVYMLQVCNAVILLAYAVDLDCSDNWRQAQCLRLAPQLCLVISFRGPDCFC